MTEYSLGQCHESHIVLGIGSQLGEAYKINAVFLNIQTGGKIVSIALIVAVVETKK